MMCETGVGWVYGEAIFFYKVILLHLFVSAVIIM
jgi:hypothetical protein